ncbi:nuclear transport factor 2 family protein [uncultured Mycolicibacterium sp.]|uniref:YybH family protein n=1 Tax=uncultured Mycolicibacterium sp. TaxID=2320817 RepID=UPI002629D867|nr:nuclear transport factor 2 family protein [uncultured Mycolicibacterium sp.]
MIRLALCILVPVAALLAACGQQPAPGPADRAPGPDPAADAAAITAALRGFPNDFNDRDADDACALFAPDVVLHHPGAQPVRGRDAVCAGLRERLSDPARSYHYDPPDIHEVLVDGDLATVAVNWRLTVRDAAGAVIETVEEDGLDVFRRGPDGTWRIHRSHAFPAG